MQKIIFILCLVTTVISQPYLPGTQNQMPHVLEQKQKKYLFQRLKKALSATPNQAQFDVHYYRLNLEIDPYQRKIAGYAQADLEVIEGTLNQLEFNLFDNMMVDSVLRTDSKAHLTFDHQDNLLTVNLDRDFQIHEQISVQIYYHGDPSESGSGAFVFTFYQGIAHFWSLSEPYGAREWWPCKDVPEDKADSADVIITVFKNLSVASNGLLVEQSTQNNKTTYHWKERYPIVTYLISVAGYEYYHYTDFYITLSGDTMPIEFFVYPDHYQNDAFRYNYSLTKEMIKAYAGYFGEYPFVQEKYGHAEFLWGGGMEHQTCSSLGGYGEGLIAHELAHQWWGDMITCQNFHHIWLNEGFATYSEALWREYNEGMEGYFDEIANDAYKGPGTIYVEDDTDEGAIFDGNLSYSKAAYVLHMLRHVVGDSNFFDILHTYYSDVRYQYGTAVTEDFQQVCEQVSGLNLSKFFQEWIYGEYYPQYNYSWSKTQIDSNYRVDLTINQVQTNTGLFWMPIDVFIHMPNGDSVFVVWDSLATQQFTFYVPEEPDSLGLDENNWILCDKNETPSVMGTTFSPTVTSFKITAAFPNPFNPRINIEFLLPKAGNVKMSLFNLRGQKLEQYGFDRWFTKGRHRFSLNLNDQASGIYFVVLQTVKAKQSIKIFLLK